MVMFENIRGDYRRHGQSLTEPAFISLVVYRYGRWALGIRSKPLKWAAMKFYGLLKFLILNVTKVWIPPQVTIGQDFHIIHAEGSLSIHPEVVIGDRCGVMHNVTIGTNMTPGAPVIGDDVFIGVNSTVLGRIRIGDRVRIVVLKANMEDRKIDFRLVEDREADGGLPPLPPRGQPAKRTKQKY